MNLYQTLVRYAARAGQPHRKNNLPEESL